jgi:large subunit ribosomal protein L24
MDGRLMGVKADVRIPEHMLAKEADKTPFRAFERPLPLASVRLVAPLPHSETGVLRDVVINELKLKKTSIAELRGDEEPSRFIAGLEPPTRIPYPEVEPETFEDHDDDTLRIEVESKTWVPTLLSPPMPPSIIDELRNKYSRFRDRHDDAYIARKLREDEEALERTKTGKKMMTPLKELRKKERMENKARGKPVLGEEMLAKIGEVMARNQARASTGQDMEAVG